MTSPVLATTIAALIQNIVYLVFNLSFHCSSGKPPEPTQPCHQYANGAHHDTPNIQPLSQNQSAHMNANGAHTEINVVNNQNNAKTPRARKGSSTKDPDDKLQVH